MSGAEADRSVAPVPGGWGRRVFAWTVFPVVLTGAVVAAHRLMQAGVTPWATLPPVVVGSFVLILVLERFFPFRERWLRSQRDVRVDASFAILDAVGLELLRPLVFAAGAAGGGWLSAHFGLGLWPDGWPLAAQLVLALVFAEFFKYWLHRWEHEVDWLWRFHATHHSVPRLYWLNASRFHPVDIGLDTIVGVGPLVAVGCSEEVIVLFMIVGAVHGAFQHANLQLRCGPLNWFFSMAELHRWHHSRELEEANRNYGQNLIVWDVVFGTRFLPRDREPPTDVGLAGLPAFPMTFLGQLASPLRWRRIREQAPEVPLAVSG
jgi:sterol desaturase/sphingolipid hydroxylase (fatty acid hydroxylase superfamily)